LIWAANFLISPVIFGGCESTLIRFEAGGWGDIQGSAKAINRVLAVLEHKGVIFSELGVELTRKPRR
jgi:hypothetical protein